MSKDLLGSDHSADTFARPKLKIERACDGRANFANGQSLIAIKLSRENQVRVSLSEIRPWCPQMLIDPVEIAGPAIRAIDPWVPGSPVRGERHQLLSGAARAQLAKISSIVRFKKGETIYKQGAPAEASFNIISGVVTAYRSLSHGREHITAFLYPGDVFGLSEEGAYANATRATTAVTAYKMPLAAMRRLFSSNADLDVDIIVKLCDELRQAQHHALLLAQKRAVAKVAMLLDLHEHLQRANGQAVAEIHLPMDRSAIADYLGLSLSAVSRAFRTLVTKKVIAFRDRRHAKILDRKAFERLADARD